MSTSNADRATARLQALPWIGAAVLASLAATLPLLHGGDFCLDDAWIHLAYARSLQLGDGFSYNPGDHETGFSSPLWALLLAALPPGPNLVLTVKLVGVLFHALTAALAARLAWDVARLPTRDATRGAIRDARWAAAVAGVLTGTLGHLVMSATSGMEVSLAAALTLATALAALHGRPRAAFACAFLAVLARPETLFFAVGFGALQRLRQRSTVALAAPLGALAALLGWIAYCLAVSGHPWPNTMYAKGAVLFGGGLAYLALEVLLQQPWVLGVWGVVLLAWGLRRHDGPLRWLLAAWLATVLAISWSHHVTVGSLFFHYRYYAFVAPVPIVGVAVSLACVRRGWVRALAVLPMLAVSAFQWPEVRALQLAMEEDIAQLHGAPARALAGTLPERAVLLVEGAGAMRYFVPRSVRVVDIVGLNHRGIAHAGNALARDCLLVAEHPTHAAMPDEWLGVFLPMFQTEPMTRHVDPTHHGGRRVFRRELHVLRVLGPSAGLRAACDVLARAPEG